VVTIHFHCPYCGKEVFKTPTTPTEQKIPGNINWFNYGYKIIEDDIRNQAIKIADKLVGNALRKAEK
jgi:hypothetical protein